MRMSYLKDVTKTLWLSSVAQQPLSNNERPQNSLPLDSEIPDGPFSFCDVSRSTDLFDITSMSITKQPVYIDDDFLIHLYGNFQKTFTGNGTIELKVDCGSHCEDYGLPVDWPGESTDFSFCEMSDIEQPSGGKPKTETCPPDEGSALITSPAYVFPMFIQSPAWYNFTFEAKTDEGERIYCVRSEVCLRWKDEEKNKRYRQGPWNNCTWPR